MITAAPEKSTQLGEILGFLGQVLDVPEELYQEAKRKYDDLGAWLKEDHVARFQSDAGIYPQGSIMLGTSIQPVKPQDDYDVDLVYRRDIKKESTTQEQLKKDVGDQLNGYIQHLRETGQEVPKLTEKKRAWTLKYRNRFHLDVLPALPDDEAAKHNRCDHAEGIIITDKELREWQHSNPKGYGNWFDDQQTALLLESRSIQANFSNVDVDQFPVERVITPLRRVVQLLKRHRDIKYQGNPDDKPISIIITTLAANAYQREADVHAALTGIVGRMRNGIKMRDGVYWVENPINPEENFADKWQAEPQRAVRFYEWLKQVETDLAKVSSQTGLHKIAESLEPVFGREVIAKSMELYGKRVDATQRTGVLRMASKTGALGAVGAVVRNNTWYGD